MLISIFPLCSRFQSKLMRLLNAWPIAQSCWWRVSAGILNHREARPKKPLWCFDSSWGPGLALMPAPLGWAPLRDTQRRHIVLRPINLWDPRKGDGMSGKPWWVSREPGKWSQSPGASSASVIEWWRAQAWESDRSSLRPSLPACYLSNFGQVT